MNLRFALSLVAVTFTAWAQFGPVKVGFKEFWSAATKSTATNTFDNLWMKTASNLASEISKKGKDVLDAYPPLTSGDRAMEPDYSPGGMPQIPSRCAPSGSGLQVTALNTSSTCGDCFAEAYRQLSAVRMAFEKLRRYNVATQNFTKKSIAFGDGVSAIHGVAALGWQSERRRIEAALDDFNIEYDKKYAELVQILREDLQAIADCERKYFKEPDWYSRYGFMYFEFMSDRYRR